MVVELEIMVDGELREHSVNDILRSRDGFVRPWPVRVLYWILGRYSCTSAILFPLITMTSPVNRFNR